jgi:hypothetical protein
MGCVWGAAVIALVICATPASAKPRKPPALQPPAGSVVLAEGKVYGQPWLAYAVKGQGSTCIYVHAQGLYWSCGEPASWIPASAILLSPTTGGGPPWVMEGFIMVRPRVVRIKATMECGRTIRLRRRHLTRRELRRSGLPRQVRVVPYVLATATEEYVVTAAGFDSRGQRVGTSTFEPPPKELRAAPPPC